MGSSACRPPLVCAERGTCPSRSAPVDTGNRDVMLKIISSAVATKAVSRWSSLACSVALDAVRTVQCEENGRKEIDIKKYARVEKVSSCSVCVETDYFLL